MAQPPKQGIPPAPPNPDPNAGTNIHGQPNPTPSPSGPPLNQPDTSPLDRPGQVNIHGQPPQPNMAPPENRPSGLADNTQAEMDAGKRNLQQYTRRDDSEHEAGRQLLQRHAERDRK
jgi:hypothetical protein